VEFVKEMSVKVTAYKTVDVECEVDVSIDDVIATMLEVAENSESKREKLRAIDGASKVLELIGAGPLCSLTNSTNDIAVRLLQRLRPIVEWCEKQGAGKCNG
jgi:hypothetical protein